MRIDVVCPFEKTCPVKYAIRTLGFEDKTERYSCLGGVPANNEIACAYVDQLNREIRIMGALTCISGPLR